MRKTTSTLAATLALACLFLSGFAHAQMPNFMLQFVQPADLLTLSASASEQAQQDSVTITLSYEQESKDPDALSAALKQHLDAALQKTQNSRSDGIHVSTGQSMQFFSSTTNSVSHGTTWQGKVQISLESKDFAAASKLAGELAPDMQVTNVQYSLSPETRHAAEDKLSRKAIAAFREKAAAAVHALGYRDYTIRQVSIASVPQWTPLAASAELPEEGTSTNLPLKGGKSTVTVTVTGSVQMK